MILRILSFAVLVVLPQVAAASVEWPNEPAGSKLILDDPLTQLNVNGWTCLCNTNPGPGISGANIFNDGTTPSSDKMVLRHRFAVGHNYQGGSPGNYWRELPRGLNEIYEGFYFKVSSGFENHPVGTKIGFMPFGLATGNGVLIPMVGSGTGLVHGPYAMDLYYPVPPTINNCHIPYPKFGDCPGTQHIFPLDHPAARWFGDVWYRVEIYIKASTTFSSQDGIYRMWHTPVGGATTLIYNITNINIAPDWSQFELNPTYGGGPQVYGSQGATEDGFFSYDHVRISAPNGAIPPGQPAAPTNLSATARAAQVDLSWEDNSGNESGFDVERKVSPTGTWSKVGSTGPNFTTYSVTGLTANHTFYFRVRATSAGGLPSNYSNEVSATPTTTAIKGNREVLAVGQNEFRISSRAGTVRFAPAHAAQYQVSVYDVTGRKVWRHAGNGKANWTHGGNLKRGVYSVRVEQDGKVTNTNFCHVW